jgi:hypothetical protein
MKKTPSKKLQLNVETIRNLTSNELSRVGGGSHVSLNPSTSVISVSSGTSVISGGTSVISRNPSGGLPSGH